MPRARRSRPAAVLCLAAIGCSLPAWAQEPGDAAVPADHFDFAFTGGAIQSDNVMREAVDEESGTIGRIGLDLSYARKSRRLDTDVDLNLNYETYPADTFDDGFFGGGSAGLVFGILPERIDWLVQENYGQITSSPFVADTPDNREDINYFTTGPKFRFQLGGAARLDFSANYSDFRYETRGEDGNSWGGLIAVVRELSQSSSLSLNLGGDHYDFDDAANGAYDRYSAYLSYSARGSRTDIEADLGYTRLDMDDDTPDGLLARLNVTRQVSASVSLSATLGTEFSTAGDLFRDGQDQIGAGIETGQVIASSDPFTSRYGSLGISFDKHRTSLSLDIRFEQERYENEIAQDRNLVRYNLSARRVLSPVLEFSLFGELEQQDFENVDFESDDTRLGSYLNWRLGRHVSLRFQYDHYDRDSTGDSGAYQENRVSAFVIWSPIASPGPSAPIP